MPANWRIDHWPPCVAHTFLSHCAEDREALVVPVFQTLEHRAILPWIDRHHYPAGRDGLETLREELLRCRHVVYFITPGSLTQGRGWTSAERTFAAMIQQRLRFGDDVCHVELPLLFTAPDDPIFQRSIWRTLVDKAQVCPYALPAESGPSNGDGAWHWQSQHVEWAAKVIEEFVRQEELWSLQLGIRFGQDSHLRQYFSGDRNLKRRILGQAPPPFPR